MRSSNFEFFVNFEFHFQAVIRRRADEKYRRRRRAKMTGGGGVRRRRPPLLKSLPLFLIITQIICIYIFSNSKIKAQVLQSV